jgi:hypothetical protein
MADAYPPVTIVGAGIAGMSAALRLVQAGRSVSVYEKSDHVGGQFGAVKDGSRYHEHAFHIFADWNQNFFAICKEIGLDRDEAFAPQPQFLTLKPLPTPDQTFDRMATRRGRPPSDFCRLEYLGAPKYFWRNANAGVAHWSDMVLYQYSILDLLSDDSLDNDDTKEFLNRVSVNGFMHSRPYASDIAALLHHELLLKVFAVPSYRTSARAYQTYLRHSAAFPPGRITGPKPSDLAPSFWAMRGNVQTTFWEPFVDTVKKEARKRGVRFELLLGRAHEVTGLTRAGDGASGTVTHVHLGNRKLKVPGDLLLAVPFTGLKKILGNTPSIAEVAPELLDVGYLEAVPVPALNLYFNKRVALPAEHMTLLDDPDDFYDEDASVARKNGIASKYGLSLVDHTPLWPEFADRQDKTVLSVLAADAKLLVSEDDDRIKRLVLDTLRQYIAFDYPGDIDLKDVHLQSHRDEPLFVNTEGSWQYRPEARLDDGARKFPRVEEKVSNLFLAGDYCRSEVDIVSLEGAIVTGISAAHRISDDVPPPIRPREFDRDRVRSAAAAVKSWIDLANRRSDRNFADRRKAVKDRKAAAAKAADLTSGG